jgi:chemotaxis methyl-accepting protein methylase/chemotaxis response regulator CheB/PAS domain-containing protein
MSQHREAAAPGVVDGITESDRVARSRPQHRAEGGEPSPGQPFQAAKAGGPEAADKEHDSDQRPCAAAREANRPPPLAIVAAGASGGGLEAFRQLLKQLPGDTGLAFVFIQHLPPDRVSALPHLIGEVTPMPVREAADGLLPERDEVYIIPPGVYLEIAHGRFHLSPRPGAGAVFAPIDVFFRSLAADVQERAVGLVLSGTGSDGPEGLREIKARGGIALVQSPESAEHDEMPRAAIATGAVDRVLRLSDLAQELARLSRHPLLHHRQPHRTGDDIQVSDEQLEVLFARMRADAGIDLTDYAPGIVKRRLQRRMLLNQLFDVASYIKHLSENRSEVEALYQDLQIQGTRFFRQPAPFEVLRSEILPRVLARRGQSIRVWVPGCSTGEHVYSMAILVLEALEGRDLNPSIQIFGTDIRGTAIEQARRGVFPAGIAAQVGDDRLLRFFAGTDGTYRIAKQVRDLCMFARHDLIRDPPFSHLDLVLCPDLLICLSAAMQKKALGIFHYALRPGGYLIAGPADGLAGQDGLFAPLDESQRTFVKRAVPAPSAGFVAERWVERSIGVSIRRSAQAAATAPAPANPPEAADDERLRALEGELEAVREHLQTNIQELEAIDRELLSANEEILSSNEELQAANEELAMAREELKTTSEELTRITEELSASNEELRLTNSNLANLLTNTAAVLVIVTSDLRIRRFTPKAGLLFNLIQGDIGRPIGHIRPNIDCPDLVDLIAQVVDKLEPVEREVRDRSGRWHALHISPHQSPDSDTEGAMLALVDIDAGRRQAFELQQAQRLADAILRCARRPVLVLDADLRVRQASGEFLKRFGALPDEAEGRHISELGGGTWDNPPLGQLLDRVLKKRVATDAVRIVQDLPGRGRVALSLEARAIDGGSDGDALVLLAIDEMIPGMD